MKKFALLLLVCLISFSVYAQDPDVGGTAVIGTVNPVQTPFHSGETVSFQIQAGSSSADLTFPAPGGSPFFVTIGTTRIINPVVTFTNPNYFTVTITQMSSTVNAQLYSIVVTQNQTIPESEYTTFTITGQAEGTIGQNIGYQANGTPGGYNTTNVGLDNPSWYGKIDAPLPVKLVSFSVAKENTNAQLTWATTEEVNADRFEIEHSTDAKDWQFVGEKQATGESKALVQYHFTDSKPASGTNYYRLKMIDKDLTYAYSRIQSVAFDENSKPQALFPNPVADVLHIEDEASGNIKSVDIINSSGQPVYKSANSGTPVSAAGISVKGLSSGIYIVKVSRTDGTHTTHKVVIGR